MVSCGQQGSRGWEARQGSPRPAPTPATAADFCRYCRNHPAGTSPAAYNEDSRPRVSFPTTHHLKNVHLLLLHHPVYLQAVIVTTRPHLSSKHGRPNNAGAPAEGRAKASLTGLLFGRAAAEAPAAPHPQPPGPAACCEAVGAGWDRTRTPAPCLTWLAAAERRAGPYHRCRPRWWWGGECTMRRRRGGTGGREVPVLSKDFAILQMWLECAVVHVLARSVLHQCGKWACRVSS